MPGGELHVACWGHEAAPVVLAIHGVTASSMSLRPVARQLAGSRNLVAPDLRGRGASASLPGPVGMEAHARDCAVVIEAFAPGPVVVLGESMGAYVAIALAAARPDVVERLVLVDGGLPLPVPEQFGPQPDLDAVILATIGPALTRLATVYPSREAYLDFWRAHPAFQHDWNADVEAYLDYDLHPVEGGYRSRVSEAAVREDSRDLLASGAVAARLELVHVPVHLLRAPRDLLDRPAPLLPEPVVDEWRRRLPNLSTELVEDVNHYSLMFGPRGARLIAERLLT